MDQPQHDLRVQRFTELDPLVAYRLWALRSQVFVLEQGAAYLDLDGRDTEPGTWHVWFAHDAGLPVATLRVLEERDGDGDGWRVGRVATDAAHRGRGQAGRLMREVVSRRGSASIVHDPQVYRQDGYAGLGFVVCGSSFEDADGVPHVPMRREGRRD